MVTWLAASAAGIPLPQISLVSEPEAAALHCLRAMQHNTIQSGDVIVVCDAVGGTVDLISYCVKSVSPTYLEEQLTDLHKGCLWIDVARREIYGFPEGPLRRLRIQKDPEGIYTGCDELLARHVKPDFSFDEDNDDNDEFQELGQLIPFPVWGINHL
ncbi:hypothetical protein BDV38DRAFT_283840 [Aspergillus pseudotamarii]|uniref:Uncharacterized protein n=1 Tax=Aspergillus pseudotamarii TaxID=132259 RepID=A0A5N6SPK7_ASPPS|nr:uncharacterized protein BDV38DRAFT_283840 [Aspergillus pseudotamarii]KAE8136628.1 hypothetical protein BDV38DRAFT_283840 [Aspergillus pseudotamarii]